MADHWRLVRHYSSGSKTADFRCRSRLRVEELLEHGFCLIQQPAERNTSMNTIMDISEERRFALSPMAKHMMSVSMEEGYVAGTGKEMFHYTPESDSVQTPPYWHIPTAVGKCFAHMLTMGDVLFNGINAHVLGHLRANPFQQEEFRNKADYEGWINAVRDSSKHVLTSIFYEESSREFHTAGHTDEGLLSIFFGPRDSQSDAPTEFEVFVDGRWTVFTLPRKTAIIICGDTLEHATGGLFRALPYRIRNKGACRWRVMKLRPEPSTVFCPSSILSNVSKSLLLESMRLSTSLHCRDLVGPIEEIDMSKSTSNPPPLPPLNLEEDMIRDASLGSYFDTLPSILVLTILDWLRDLRDLYNLSLVCHTLHRVANSDVLCIPAAESSHINWGAALDRIDRGVPSHGRTTDYNMGRMVTNELLESVSGHWIRLLGEELTGNSKRMRDPILIVIASSLDDTETFFKVRYSMKLQKAFDIISERTGIEIESLRFRVNGRIIRGNTNSREQKLGMHFRITYSVLQQIEA